MIAMRPIREYDVIDLLNNGRFEGEVEGYVVMDGPKYLGHMLYRVDGAVTQVLECGVEEKMFGRRGARLCGRRRKRRGHVLPGKRGGRKACRMEERFLPGSAGRRSQQQYFPYLRIILRKS